MFIIRIGMDPSLIAPDIELHLLAKQIITSGDWKRVSNRKHNSRDRKMGHLMNQAEAMRLSAHLRILQAVSRSIQPITRGSYPPSFGICYRPDRICVDSTFTACSSFGSMPSSFNTDGANCTRLAGDVIVRACACG